MGKQSVGSRTRFSVLGLVLSGQGGRVAENSFLWSKSQPVHQRQHQSEAAQLNRSSNHKPSFNISAFGASPTVRRGVPHSRPVCVSMLIWMNVALTNNALC